ncbi:glycosyltransferase family 4 protein [Microbacterium sp. E-13]|uniref:glycosyltransferase family 4 protein n=1 Tax=Microbacterium sp. E-13 TaxID=3404048 RepID=UPI003CF99942
MPGRRIIHVITPGDHFSPLTGSAIPTVVHGLAGAAVRDGEPRPAVVVDRSTWQPRYDSAVAIEYAGARGPDRRARYADAVRGRLGMPRRAVAAYYRPIAEAVRAQPPSIVLAHNAPILVWLLRDTPHRVVLYAHNDLLRTYSRAEAGRMLRSAAAIVCVSESLAARTRARLPEALRGRVHVVGNGVDTAQFAPADARLPGPVRVMFMGRVIPDKGADVLLRAVAQLDGAELDSAELEVLIVGRPGFAADAPLSEHERELRELAVRSGADVRFQTFVARAELPALLRTADVFVVPSRWPDPSPLTVGEALATGLPIIASRIGGIPEALGDAGILVPPDDPAALADALRGLIADPARRAALATAARARAEQHDWSWSWRRLDAVVDQL